MQITKKIRAFTLVELIVVIVILAILATIAFLSFSSQSASARDSTRLSDMSNIAKGLSIFNVTSGSLPKPENSISILASGSTIGYQGYAGSSILNMIKISNGGKDPLDANTYYTYSINSANSKFEILGFLEDGTNSSLSMNPRFFNQPGLEWANADLSSYIGRYVITKGDPLGILLNSTTMVPVQAPGAISGTGVDIVTTTGSFSVYFDSKNSLTGTGLIISAVQSLGSKSCKELLNKDGSKRNKDGIYYINQTSSKTISVYCDMTTDGGGWTRIFYQDYDNSVNTTSINLLSSARPYIFNYNKFEEIPASGISFSELLINMKTASVMLLKIDGFPQSVTDLIKSGTAPSVLAITTANEITVNIMDLVNNTSFPGAKMDFYWEGAIFGDWSSPIINGQWWVSNNWASQGNRFMAKGVVDSASGMYSSTLIR